MYNKEKGKKIHISEMSDIHLLNAHRMVNEQLIELKNIQENAFVFAPGENAMAYEDDFAAVDETYRKYDDLKPRERILSKELDRRKLKPLPLRMVARRTVGKGKQIR